MFYLEHRVERKIGRKEETREKHMVEREEAALSPCALIIFRVEIPHSGFAPGSG